MTEYIIQLEGRGFEYPTAIMIIERKMYEREIGGEIENNPDIKIVKKYPSKLEKNLTELLGLPVMICPESKIFTIDKEYKNCIRRMFDNI